jgi:eukaryotic-like serine/threonine-protein kinase
MAKPSEDRWHEIDAIFAAALEQEPSQREAFLARASGSDEALRRAVAALLRASTRAESFLETPIFTLSGGFRAERVTGLSAEGSDAPETAAADADPAGSMAAPLPDLLGLTGRQVSHFRVQSVLSAGGMGLVYRGHDLRLGRPVALKFLLPQYSLDASAKERFLQEARAASLLDHPNICTVHETGETPEGHLFLAMSCYEGETLHQRLAGRGALPIEDALDLARQSAHGLGTAHAAGIVHRDLKPGNLMLLPDGTLKILDFGLAKVRDLSITRSGERAGTVAYMSPEQLQGEPVDGRSDLWSLGAVLYEMLTGKLPFGTGHEIATAYRILSEEPAPLSSLRPEIPPGLEQLVGKLLRKEPAERYATAAEVLQALEAVAAGSSVLPAADTPEKVRPRQPRRPQRLTRARRGVLVGTLVLLAGTAGSLAIARGGMPAGSEVGVVEPLPVGRADVADGRSIAVLPFVNLSGDPEQDYFSDGITEELLNALVPVEGLRVAARSSSFSFKGKNVPMDSVGRALNVAHVLEGSVRRSGNRVRITAQLVNAADGDHLWSETYDRELRDVFAIQNEIARAIAGALRLQLTSVGGVPSVGVATADPLAHELYLRGLYHYRRRNLALATTHFERAIARDSQFARAYAALAVAAAYLPGRDRRASPSEFRERSRQAAQRALELDPTLPEAHEALGHVRFHYDWDFTAAEQSFLSAIKLNPSYADAYVGLAIVWSSQRRDEQALAAVRRAAELDPVDPLKVCNHVWRLLQANKYSEALRQLDVSRREHNMDCGEARIETHYMLAQYRNALAAARRHYEQDRSPEEAAVLTQMAEDVLGAKIRGEQPRSDWVRIVDQSSIPVEPLLLAKWYTWAGDYDAALRVLEHMVAERDPFAVWITFPWFDTLRSDSRYRELTAKVGLQ